MEIRPYKSGRVGQTVPLDAAIENRVMSGHPAGAMPGTFALNAHVRQQDAFCLESSGSLRYLLLLSGVVPNLHEMPCGPAMQNYLRSAVPEIGNEDETSIAVLLIL